MAGCPINPCEEILAPYVTGAVKHRFRVTVVAFALSAHFPLKTPSADVQCIPVSCLSIEGPTGPTLSSRCKISIFRFIQHAMLADNRLGMSEP